MQTDRETSRHLWFFARCAQGPRSEANEQSAITATAYFALRALARTRVGLAFRAIADNLDAARASGIDPGFYRGVNLTISCARAGILGSFYAHFIGILTPDITASSHTVEILPLAYIGRREACRGGIFAAFLV